MTKVRTYGTNLQETVPDFGNDLISQRFHNWCMAKPKHRKDPKPGWFVAEWLVYLKLEQTVLIEGTGRSKGRISELVTGKQRFNEDDLAAFSRILGVTRGYLLEVNPLTKEGGKWAERGRIRPPPSQSEALPTGAEERGS